MHNNTINSDGKKSAPSSHRFLPLVRRNIRLIIKKAFAMFVALLGFLVVMWGLILFGFQSLYWFKAGVWIPVSLLMFLSPSSLLAEIEALSGRGVHGFHPYDLIPDIFWGSFPWLDHPSNWFGAHKLIHGFLGMVPLSLALIALGFTILVQNIHFEQP